MGALLGAGLCILVGPVAVVVGAIVGAGIGAASGWAAEMRMKETDRRNQKLDKEIGVTEGDIGIRRLEHPSAKIGSLSREASGAGQAETGQAQGPVERPPD